MKNFFLTYRPQVEANIRNYFQNKRKEASINDWQIRVYEKLEALVLKGKLMRGCFVILGSCIEGQPPPKSIFKLAIAIEIFHTAFLIHDDIMDQEEMRRGDWSIHNQFKIQALNQELDDPEQFGKSMAINTGDIALFLAFEIVNDLNLDSRIQNQITSLITSEMIKLGAAQMQDVYLGSSKTHVSEAEILNVYKYKTAGYSFILPLKLGMILNNHKGSFSGVEKLGELLGLIYQIKDDEINLFTKMRISGKSNGSDLRLKKKTLYYKCLMDNLSPLDFKKLELLIKNPVLTTQDLSIIASFLKKANILELVNQKVQSLSARFKTILSKIELDPAVSSIFEDLLAYILQRQK